MSGPGQAKWLPLRRFAPLLWVVLAWLGARFARGGEGSTWDGILDFLDRFTHKAFGGFPAAQSYVQDLVCLVDWGTTPTLATYAAWAMFAVPLGFVVRLVARARIRSGAHDPLEPVRAWVLAHAKSWGAILGVMPALWGLLAFRILSRNHEVAPFAVLPVALASTAFEYLAARATFRAFFAPTIDPGEESSMEIGPDEIVFDAVAVTREALAAIGALAAVSLGMAGWIAALPIVTLFRDARLFVAVGVYMAVAALSAAVFRAASRVAVGVDGVLVKGTSRTRFFPYGEIDDVATVGGDVHLVRRGKVVLRLQLHGADAVRRDAVVARIRENLARVQRGEHAMAAQIVSSSSQEQLTRVASGGADYRAATLSREALWQLIEGPSVGSDARRAAAEALARTSDAVERTRLRVAAEHCADPKVRVALTELAEEDYPTPGPAPQAGRGDLVAR